MTAGATARADDATGTVRVRAAALPTPRETVFRIALAGALFVHAALIVGFTRSSSPRQMGEKSGRPDGISVELVEAADLRSKNTFATDGAPPGAIAPAQPAAKTADQSLEQQAKAPAPPSPKAAAELVPPPEKAAKPSEKADKEQPKEQEQTSQPETLPKEAPKLAPAPAPEQVVKAEEVDKQDKPWSLDKLALELVLPEPGKKSEPPPAAKPAPAPKPSEKPAPQPQLKLPNTPFVPSAISAGLARPAGITRSGENDEFGRGVIRALRKTMPPGGPQQGQVTVRFLLSDYGNLAELRLERSSGDPLLDQNVMFAVKQSSFPFPPPKAPPVDRTFLVTYIYR